MILASIPMEYLLCMAGGGREVSLPGVVFLEAELSLRNCSRKDIWEEGRSPSTKNLIKSGSMRYRYGYWLVNQLKRGAG